MVGFTGVVYTDFYSVVAPNVYNVSTYVSDPTNAGAGLQNALNAVKATGGTLVFSAGVTYTTAQALTLDNAADVYLKGQGATIKAANSLAFSAHVLQMRASKNFHIDNLTIDGNRANRADNGGFCLILFEVNSNNVGGGRCSLNNCYFKDSPQDGIGIRGEDANGHNSDRHPRNILIYKCRTTGCWRVGGYAASGHNIQILGGTYTDQNVNVSAPAAGWDLEPNDPVTIGDVGSAQVSQVLFRGLTVERNAGKGIHIAGNKGSSIATGGHAGVEDVTIEGCLGQDGAGVANPTSATQGSFTHVIGTRVLVQHNRANGFTRTTDAGIYAIAGADARDCLFFDNYANNITTGDPIYKALGTSGSGNAFTNNHAFNINGGLDSNSAGGNCTFSGDVLDGTATTPSPDAPWDVTFANEGGGGGNIPAYEAKLGETIEADATAGTTTDVTVTTAAVAGSALIVSISFADQTSAGQAVSSVVLDPSGANVAGVLLAALTSGTNPRRQEVWGFLAPAAMTSKTLRVTYNQSVNAARVTVHQYSGVESFGATATTVGSAVAQSIDLLTTRANSKVFVGQLGYRSNATPTSPQYTPGGSAVERTDDITGSTLNRDLAFEDLDVDVATISTATISSTSLISLNFVMVAVELKSTVQSRVVSPTGLSVSVARGTPNIQTTVPSTIVAASVTFLLTTSLNLIDTVVIGTENNTFTLDAGFDALVTSLGEIEAFAKIITPTGFALGVAFGTDEFRIAWLTPASLASTWVRNPPI